VSAALSERLRPGVEAAPWVIEEVKRLEVELEDAYAEICKQVAGSKVVFDRELVNRAKAAGVVA